jgi:hypothetical protein
LLIDQLQDRQKLAATEKQKLIGIGQSQLMGARFRKM